VVEGWLIGEVGFFEVLLGNHRSDGYFCPSTLYRGEMVVGLARWIMGGCGAVAVASSGLIIVWEDGKFIRGQEGQRRRARHMCIDNSTR